MPEPTNLAVPIFIEVFSGPPVTTSVRPYWHLAATPDGKTVLVLRSPSHGTWIAVAYEADGQRRRIDEEALARSSWSQTAEQATRDLSARNAPAP